MHEEDAGIIWKHTELRTMHPEVRRGRKLVISFIATVGQQLFPFSSAHALCFFNAHPMRSLRNSLGNRALPRD